MIADLLQRLNWALLCPILVYSALHRLRKLWSSPQQVLMGLTCCLPRRSTATGFEWGQVSGGMQPQDKKLQSLGLCLVVLEPTLFKRHVITQQTFYKNFEILVELGLWCVLVHVLAAAGDCWLQQEADKSMHCLYTLTPLCMTVGYALQAPLQIVYLTGWRAHESKLSVIVGAVGFVLTLVVLSLPQLDSWDPLRSGLEGMVKEAALHMQALMMALAERPPQASLITLIVTVRLLLSAFVGLAAAGMVLPALRFSQTLLSIALDDRTDGPSRVGRPQRVLVVCEHLAALAAALACSGLLSTPGDGPALLAATAWLALRFACCRLHLQSFLDTVTRSAYLLPDGLDVTTDAKLVAKIQNRTEYLVAAAAQLLCLPVLLLALLLLYARYSAVGEGACLWAHSLAGRDASHCAALFALRAHDSLHATANTASLAAAFPWLSSVIGVMMHSHKAGGQIVLDFFFKLATLHPLPGSLARRLCLSAVSTLAATWFGLTSAAALYWYIGPEWVTFLFGARLEIATQHLPKPIPGGSREERAREAAAMAARSSVPHATSTHESKKEK